MATRALLTVRGGRISLLGGIPSLTNHADYLEKGPDKTAARFDRKYHQSSYQLTKYTNHAESPTSRARGRGHGDLEAKFLGSRSSSYFPSIANLINNPAQIFILG